MKVKSKEELDKLIELARKKGSITFLSDHPEGDRQKIYRMLREVEELPLFPDEDKMTVRTHGDEVKIERQQSETIILTEWSKASKAPPEPKVKKKPVPKWIEKALSTLDIIEALPNCDKITKQEFLDVQRLAIEICLEFPDDDLKALIEGPGDAGFDKRVIKVFAPQLVEEFPDGPLTISDKIEKLVQRKGESNDKREIEQIDNQLEQLRRLRDEEQWKPGADLLG